MQQFFDKASEAARQAIVARLMEIDRQGTYQFSQAERTTMVPEFARLVSQNGVACSANVCGNRKLQQWVFQQSRENAKQMSQADVQKMVQQFKQAADPRPLSAQQKAAPKPAPTAQASDYKQYKVRWVKIANFASVARKVVNENPWLFGGLLLAMLGAGALVAMGKRRPVAWAELRIDAGR